ncbi:unnamed protein product [Didymodactylos carnosus]|uniref:Uncharacterized protein n=1 Tax=Didymodactylos carnosus TaxID=1234261 RepID=A0A814R9X1_9BILA|nr:unnamed protein product [Didymodactylos carnosus]CAF1548808.1 unnamed protein product [Didymodactylos carnosus]CAF3892920.1 unnamed protein product [Didymodactylos carnosus]CAF4338445.1 unnamed protein product [Didymodactylos carnosus]
MALLSACRTHKQDKKAKEIYDKITDMKNISNDYLAFVNDVTGNTHASAGKLQQELIDYGHKYDFSLIIRRVKTEDGETPLPVIMGHSEKLTIAYGLISTNHYL